LSNIVQRSSSLRLPRTCCSVTQPGRARSATRIPRDGSRGLEALDREGALADLGDDEWRRFVCVDTCQVSPFALDLAPGQAQTLRAVVTVE
jgi:hypothetical protein